MNRKEYDNVGNKILEVAPAGYKAVPSINSFDQKKAVVIGYTIQFDTLLCTSKKYLCAVVDGIPGLLMDTVEELGYKNAVVVSMDTIRLGEFI